MHTLAITDSHKLISWGLDECIGRSGCEDVADFVDFPKDTLVIDVACSECASACIDDDGHIWIWGTFRVAS